MPDNHELMYARLRADVLLRHFAVGRFWRVNQYDSEALLGSYPWASGQTRMPCGTAWEVPAGGSGPLYGDANALRLLPLERFRIAKHDRTNSLLVSGLRAIGHAMEHRLGQTDALPLMREMLKTFAALFKFDDGSSPFSGYIVRWDAVASDRWTMLRDAPDKPARPIRCCEFLLNPDAKEFRGRRYLYSTPFGDPRYRAAVQAGNKDLFRRWEPSIDEYVGLVTSYVLMFDALRNDSSAPAQALVAEIRRQTILVGRYLQHTGYFLVRPNGGFTGRGFAEMNSALQYPFGLAFKFITGNSFPVSRHLTFTDVMNMAGYSSLHHVLRPRPLHRQLLTQIRRLLDERFGRQAREALLQFGAGLIPSILDDIAANELGLGEVDVVHDEDRKTLIMGAVLMRLAAVHPSEVYEQWMLMQGDGPSEGFKPLIGLIGDAAGSLSVVDTYMRWYGNYHRRAGLGRAETRGDGDREGNVLFHAVAMLLSQSPILSSSPLIRNDPAFSQHRQLTPQLETYVSQELIGMREALRQDFDSRPPVIFFNANPFTAPPGAPEQTASELLDCASHYQGYLAALAVAWRHEERSGRRLTNLGLPTATSVADWARPAAAASEVRQILLQNIEYPLGSLDTTYLVSLSATAPLDALVHPPARALDNAIGNPPPPQQGPETEISLTYTVLQSATQTATVPVPPPVLEAGESASDYILVMASENILTRDAVKRVSFNPFDNGMGVTVEFEPPGLVRTSTRPFARLVWRGRFRARYSASWMRRS